MDREAILNTIKRLAQSQGFYGRLLNHIENDLDDEERDKFLTALEEENFQDSLDLVLFFEC